jgi:hypothetical protein
MTEAKSIVGSLKRCCSVKTGDLFEKTFTTSKGNVGLLAEVEVQGKLLHLNANISKCHESGAVQRGIDR